MVERGPLTDPNSSGGAACRVRLTLSPMSPQPSTEAIRLASMLGSDFLYYVVGLNLSTSLPSPTYVLTLTKTSLGPIFIWPF